MAEVLIFWKPSHLEGADLLDMNGRELEKYNLRYRVGDISNVVDNPKYRTKRFNNLRCVIVPDLKLKDGRKLKKALKHPVTRKVISFKDHYININGLSDEQKQALNDFKSITMTKAKFMSIVHKKGI